MAEKNRKITDIKKEDALWNPYLVIERFKSELKDAPCSAKHHLNVKGGLMVHLKNVAANAKKYFPEQNPEYESLFFLASIHDIGKARVYAIDEQGNITYKKPEADHILHTITMLAEVGITLNAEELNALQFHHGGWSGFKGEMTTLAAKLHFCDLLATQEENINQKQLESKSL